MKIFILLLYSLGSYFFTSTNEDNSKYFRDIAFRESPYAKIQGIHELNKSESADSFHYKFDYDNSGRLIKITQRIGDQNAIYNPDPNRFFINSPIIKISYDNGSELREYHNHNEQPMATESGVRYERYELDTGGNPTKLTYLDEDKNPVENKWGISRYEWRQTNAFVEEKRFNLKGELKPMRPGLEFYITGLEYDEKGFITRFANYDEDGSLKNSSNGMAYDKIKYNRSGNFIGWATFDENNKPVINQENGIAGGENFINDKGKIYKTHYYDTESKLVNSKQGYAKIITLYDKRTNIIGWEFYTSEGKNVKVGDSEIVSGISEYDNKKRRVAYYFVDRNGKYTNHPTYGFAYIQYKYDEDDRLVEESFYDEHEQLSFFNQKKAAKLQYHYKEGKIIKTLRYNEKGKRLLQ